MTYELKAIKREQFKKAVQAKRAEGLIPAIIYGPELPENVPVFIKANEFKKIYDEAGASALVNLQLEGEKEAREVLVKQVDFDPVKVIPVHADMYQIKRGQKLELSAELNFFGVSPAEKNLFGTLITNLTEIAIKCLPKDIISKFDVDLSVLETFEDKITVRDLNIPSTIEVLTDLDEAVALVVPPRLEEKDAVKEVAPEEVKKEEGKEDDKKEEVKK